MPRVTVRNARTETLRETLETERRRWGHEGPPERFKPLFAEIEAELKYRDEQLEHQPWRFADIPVGTTKTVTRPRTPRGGAIVAIRTAAVSRYHASTPPPSWCSWRSTVLPVAVAAR